MVSGGASFFLCALLGRPPSRTREEILHSTHSHFSSCIRATTTRLLWAGYGVVVSCMSCSHGPGDAGTPRATAARSPASNAPPPPPRLRCCRRRLRARRALLRYFFPRLRGKRRLRGGAVRLLPRLDGRQLRQPGPAARGAARGARLAAGRGPGQRLLLGLYPRLYPQRRLLPRAGDGGLRRRGRDWRRRRRVLDRAPHLAQPTGPLGAVPRVAHVYLPDHLWPAHCRVCRGRVARRRVPRQCAAQWQPVQRQQQRPGAALPGQRRRHPPRRAGPRRPGEGHLHLRGYRSNNGGALGGAQGGH